jgi:hypothetical protein
MKRCASTKKERRELEKRGRERERRREKVREKITRERDI